jgi:enamine deaminase RidA (YjgF/YER057c/UK114 family)
VFLFVTLAEHTGAFQLLTWVNDRETAGASALAEDAYRALDATLQRTGGAILQERVYGSLAVAADILRGRERAVGAGNDAWAVAPTIIDGTPIGGAGIAGIHIVAAAGDRGRLVVRGDTVLGRVVETSSVRLLGLTDVARVGASTPSEPAEDARVAIEAAEHTLAAEGFTFRDVVRTWYHLRDILAWYGPFNAARNEAFRRLGLIGPSGDGAVPASTGIAGTNARGGWCALDLIAARSIAGAPIDMQRMHNRRQNEATAYGSAFARGMSLTIGGFRYLFVSGTASIDDHGATVHLGDFDAQTHRTIEAIQALLEGAGASLGDVCQATVFLKSRDNAGRFGEIARAAGLDRIPPIAVVADVCRDNLLVEIEGTAVVPVHDGEAQR